MSWQLYNLPLSPAQRLRDTDLTLTVTDIGCAAAGMAVWIR